MTRLAVLPGLLMYAGMVLMLSRVNLLARPSLTDRLRPYVSTATRAGRHGTLSFESFKDVVQPLAAAAGNALSRMFGIHEDLSVRLERAHFAIDATQYRLRQLLWSFGGLVGAAAAATATRVPVPVGVLFSLGAPLLVFLVLEQRVATASRRWQTQVFRELPVVSEQLGLLIGAGYSLGSALQRLSRRGSGACGQDLQRVVGRMRQGLSEIEALREWAAIVDLAALHRLVAVLALNREAGDLGRLIADEARSIRRDAQRELIERLERRSQQVWVPVTVATLVPGVIFMAVPFVEALSLLSGS